MAKGGKRGESRQEMEWEEEHRRIKEDRGGKGKSGQGRGGSASGRTDLFP